MSEPSEEFRVPPVVGPPMRGKLAGHRGVATEMPVAKERTTVVAVVVGGWLKDQTAHTLQPALRECGIKVVSPSGLDDWRAPIAAMAKEAIREAAKVVGGTEVRGTETVALALLGHSFGAQAVCQAVRELAREGIYPALVGLIDPVSTRPGVPRPIVLDTAFRTRGGVLRVYYRRFLLGPIRANVVDERGGRLATLHEGCRRMGWGHNTMCHCEGVVSELVGVVRGLGRFESGPQSAGY